MKLYRLWILFLFVFILWGCTPSDKNLEQLNTENESPLQDVESSLNDELLSFIQSQEGVQYRKDLWQFTKYYFNADEENILRYIDKDYYRECFSYYFNENDSRNFSGIEYLILHIYDYDAENNEIMAQYQFKHEEVPNDLYLVTTMKKDNEGWKVIDCYIEA